MSLRSCIAFASLASVVVLAAPAAAAAPPTPAWVNASVPAGGNDVSVAFDDQGAPRFQLHRSTASLYTPSASTLVRTCTLTPCRDAVPGPGTYYYKVIAEGTAGEPSLPASAPSVTASFNAASVPAIEITTPAEGATVSGTAVPIRYTKDATITVDGRTVADTNAWDTTAFTNGEHEIVARTTGFGNLVGTAKRTVIVDNARASALVAAYGFEGGTGTIAQDDSGNDRNGVLDGAGWTYPGRHGTALQLDGFNDSVDLPALGGFAERAFTLEAWVRPYSIKYDAGILGSWDWRYGGGPMLWAGESPGHLHATIGSGYANYLNSGAFLRNATWQHLATTFDGERLRFYIDGAQVAERLYLGAVGRSDVWRIGGYGDPVGGFFHGAIDDVRIYRRALTGAELAEDLEAAVGGGSADAPMPPATLTGDGGVHKADLEWSASSGATRYNVHRSTTAGFTPSEANRVTQVATPTTTFSDRDLPAGLYHYVVTAENAAGTSGPSAQRSIQVQADTTEPTAIVLPVGVNGTTISGTYELRGQAYDAIRVQSAQWQLDGANLGPRIDNPESIDVRYAWDTTSVPNGPHVITLVVIDAAGNRKVSAPKDYVINNVAVEPGAGLVAAYGFEGRTGTVIDDSGNERHGSVAGYVAFPVPGKHGSAFEFTGGTSRVNLPPLGTFYRQGFTLEAWVKAGSQLDGGIVGTWTYESGGGPLLWIDHVNGRFHAITGTSSSSYLDSGRTPTNAWQHIAATYDGHTLTYYIDGEFVKAKQVSPSLLGGSNTWRIGAYGSGAENSFRGSIDDVRIYNRALSQPEVRTDMGQSAAPSDSTPPTPPSSAGTSEITANSAKLRWGNSTDEVGVAGYVVYKNGVEVASVPASPREYTFTGLACTTYYEFTVRARDAAGNRSPATAANATTLECPPETALIAAYNFDEASGDALDTSGGGHHGQLVGASRRDDGKHGRAVSLAGGTHRVELGQLGRDWPQSGITLEAWVRPRAGYAWNDAGILGTWDYGSGGGVMLWQYNNRIQATFGTGLSSYLTGSMGVTFDEWQHLAVTYDGTDARLYRNGVEIGTRRYTNGIGLSNFWRVGAYSSSPAGALDGLVDDVRIYSRALAAEEIQRDLAAPVAAAPAT